MVPARAEGRTDTAGVRMGTADSGLAHTDLAAGRPTRTLESVGCLVRYRMAVQDHHRNYRQDASLLQDYKRLVAEVHQMENIQCRAVSSRDRILQIHRE